jgi:hypothetical protein
MVGSGMTEDALIARNKELIDGLASDVISLGPDRREVGLQSVGQTLLEIVTEYVPDPGFRERWVHLMTAAVRAAVESGDGAK